MTSDEKPEPLSFAGLLSRVIIEEWNDRLQNPALAMRLLVADIESIANMRPEPEHLGLCCITPEARDQLVRDMLEQCDNIAAWFNGDRS